MVRFHFDEDPIPRVTFTSPEVASVGVGEADAPANARVVYLPMGENDRAVTADQTEGFIKLIVGPRRLMRNLGGGRVLGATIVAPRAGEMIHEPALAMRTRMLAGRLAQTVHAYPTWSIGIQKAAAQLFFEIEGRRARPVRQDT
jgi:pyruvate/2-oxoglutarate dehydrogenase complex dihydrolipoamide dehydrogenase (E3) component